MRYIAKFYPQVWINDNAVDIDPEGEQEWEPSMVPEYIKDALADSDLMAHYSHRLGVLDQDDALADDPAAPEWVRKHRGPFSIYVRREED